ncbi:bifunctional 2-polyprenyl-6-hydroxyphenol methylase/3-demethylubiquinol 3-O-methyltransferase UbiG [Acidisphaera sp. S103]|uniref:class I SAM-dependent methyltransferase n=1 Tax=Acidisphaera sp. S103 TaxID=1747223 RepID=UPI00131D7871|nr:methyltransferase domain-containing protein [Acidisphaera sp. S103]
MSEHYAGSELSLFAEARHWKSYVATLLRPWLGPRVLDVGAGIGSNLPLLFADPVKQWVALEPDADLLRQVTGASRTIVGTLDALDPSEQFDAILYLDVVEHIEDDAAELERAFRHLLPGGRLIVLVPAHQFLFSPFDAAIGHFRRYGRSGLRRIGPAEGRLECLLLLDSVGFLASLANRLVLRSSMPTAGQIRLWDQAMVPMSRVIDRLLSYRVGKSVLGVWSHP